MSLLHVTERNFAEVQASEKPVLIDFFATWCGPCRMIAPIIEALADEHPEYLVCKVDTDEAPELAAAFGIEVIPTVVVLKNGKITAKATGVRPKEAILSMLEN